jgi:hypothetical protein
MAKRPVLEQCWSHAGRFRIREAAGFVSRAYRWIGAGMTTAEALRTPRAA